uniref:Cytidyltransferase-like domain-containing protein n=1 Tax=Zooxanthella nutricula TaxID=1333877 RepID=A0A7S2MJA2_9DINO
MAEPDGPGAKPRRRVAIYGGAFDPVTNSHLTCASEIVHSGQADEVWLVPCGKRPDKPKLKTPPMDRYVMCQIAVNTMFSPEFPIKASDIECFEPEALFTYDLLCNMREKHPDVDFCFVIGSDWLQSGTNISSWQSKNQNWKLGDPEDQKNVVTGHKLLDEFDFLVVPRPGYVVERNPEDPTGLQKFGPRLQWLAMPDAMTFIEGNLSSTEIRKRTEQSYRVREAAEHRSLETIEGLVPPGVLAYIRRAHLYSA